ncbi:MAG: autotransporter-associated beta strand repeat-containing protein, partial [Candidatus Hydrogenedentes bacterium]|nr:autotransporter-associated beta strand repeat-containing protein [Candidatus Hydrogenedentota bacterium]
MSDSLRHRFSCVISGSFFARGIVRDRPARPSWNGLELLEPRLLLSALYWDPDGDTTDNDPDNGAHLGGTGSWTTDSNAKVWYDPASPDQDIAWPSCGGYEAVFWGTGTVTLSVSITAQGVTFKTDGYTIQSNTLTLSCGNVEVTSANTMATISSVIAGSCGLTKKGSGDLTVSGANTYTGTTTIKNGKLVLSSFDNRLPTGTTVTLGDSGAGTTGILKLNNHDQEVAGLATSGSSANNQIINGGLDQHTLTVNTSSGDSSFSGVLANGSTGKLKLTKKGSYTLTLSGASTDTGDTKIEAGTLALGGDTGVSNRLPTCTTVTLGDSGSSSTGTLKLGGHNQEVAGLTRANTYSGNQVINGSATPATLTVNTGAACEFAGVLADGSGSSSLSIVKAGAGTLSLTGSNSHTGATTISGGVLRAGLGSGLPNASNLVFGGTCGGGVWEGSGTFSRSLGTGAGQVQWTGDGGFSAYGGALTVNLGGSSSQVTWGSGNFVPDDHVLMFDSAASDNQVVFANPIDMGTCTRTVSVKDNSGSSSDSAKLSGDLDWGYGLAFTKSGDGRLILSGTISTCSCGSGFMKSGDGGVALSGTMSMDSYGSDILTVSEGILQFQVASANPLP